MIEIEIVAIGNEVLAGLTLNSNAAWLSKHLFDAGYRVSRHTTLPDDEKTLEEELPKIATRAGFTIVTGGLGPTIDDITGPIAVKLFGKAALLSNSVGSAPGLLYDKIVMLPGVPLEMQAIFLESVLPHMKKMFLIDESRLRKHIHFCLLPEKAVDPELRRLKELYPVIDFGIYPQPGTVSVTLTANKKDENILEKVDAILKEHFKSQVFESATGKIDEAVHQLLSAKKVTLSLAESMTGGNVARKLTLYPGASAYFLGGVVCYSNESKENLLHVDPAAIEKQGAVSEVVVKQMAEGALHAFGSDYSLAITGIAGPDGATEDKPLGFAWCALGQKGKPTLTWKIEGRRTSRAMNIEFGTLNLLSHLYLSLVKEN